MWDDRRASRTLAKRWLALTEEITATTTERGRRARSARHTRPARATGGGRSDVAAKRLIAAGDNPQRIRIEAGFVALCGVNPVQASSGKTNRNRLNRSGDRQANNALWTIARVRLSHHPATAAYAARRNEEGLSHREIVRCIKRYLARQLFPILTADLSELT